MTPSKTNSILLCLLREMTLSGGEEWYPLKRGSVKSVIHIYEGKAFLLQGG